MSSKEIGGYQEFERYYGPMLHEDGIKLNCGRNCLAYLIEAKGINEIWLPCYICDSVINVCKFFNVIIHFYHIGMDFMPTDIDPRHSSDWVYLVNFFGQLSSNDICKYKAKFGKIIVDNAQAYFEESVEEVDTIYTCRKFFGVADGAILYSDSILGRELEYDESFQHMGFLLGRFERTASEFYPLMVQNNKRFSTEPIKKMSKLTENLLHSIDYNIVQQVRTDNYSCLAEKLSAYNKLKLNIPKGPFAYPFMIENAKDLRKRLIEKKIYVPTLWPNVFEIAENNSVEYHLVQNTLPIPCDQRYNLEDMDYITQVITQSIDDIWGDG